MCNCFADGDIEVEERAPRYPGEPRRTRLSFVREKGKSDAKRSDEVVIYQPRSSETVRPYEEDYQPFDEPRDEYRPHHDDYARPSNAQYRAPMPMEPIYHNGFRRYPEHDFQPFPPQQLPPPPPMAHIEPAPYDNNPHGVEILNPKDHHDHNNDPVVHVLDQPSRAMTRRSRSRAPRSVVVHSSRRGRRGSRSRYYDDKDDDSWDERQTRTTSTYSADDSWDETEVYRPRRHHSRRSRSKGDRGIRYRR